MANIIRTGPLKFSRFQTVIICFFVIAILNLAVMTAMTLHRIPHFRIWLAHSTYLGLGTRADVLDYPHARDIAIGMTKNQVRGLVGSPTDVRHVAYFGPGDIWDYHFFGWNDPIMVVFDTSGKVIHRSYGHG